LAEATFTTDVLAVALLGVLTSCALWWTYFPVAKPELEHALASASPEKQGALARDAYSLAHFPMLCGVVAYAVALEEAVAHPGDALPAAARLALALGPLMFVGGTALAMWRATCGRPVHRVLVAGLAGLAILLLDTVPASIALAVTLAGVTLVAALDERRADRVRRRA
jgi:low temperature requirement protein LtrA